MKCYLFKVIVKIIFVYLEIIITHPTSIQNNPKSADIPQNQPIKWNYIIPCKLLVFDRNTWNHIKSSYLKL